VFGQLGQPADDPIRDRVLGHPGVLKLGQDGLQLAEAVFQRLPVPPAVVGAVGAVPRNPVVARFVRVDHPRSRGSGLSGRRSLSHDSITRPAEPGTDQEPDGKAAAGVPGSGDVIASG